jgi:hypothetical protein
MRKVTRQAVQAFYNNVNFRSGNTTVENGKLYLHGNLIAKKENGNVYISNAGWQSNTTKERLNGLSGVHISQKNLVWYLNGKEWNGQWTKI